MTNPVLFALLIAVTHVAPAFAAEGPSVSEVIAFTQIDDTYRTNTLRSRVSPNGRHVAVVTLRGNVQADRNRYELLLLDVSPEALERGQPKTPVVLHVVERAANPSLLSIRPVQAGDRHIGLPMLREVKWVNDSTVAFLALDGGENLQVHSINMRTRKVRQHTFSVQSVLAFDISADLSQVVYAVNEMDPGQLDNARPIVVGNGRYVAAKRVRRISMRCALPIVMTSRRCLRSRDREGPTSRLPKRRDV